MSKTKERQYRVMDLYYRARPGSKIASSLNKEYGRLTKAIGDELGRGANCNDVDPMLFSLYSDWFKDLHGFRPGNDITVGGVQDWIASQE